MNKKVFAIKSDVETLIVLLWAIMAGMWQGNAAPSDVKSPPNIIFFMADDVGYDDVGCFGSKRIQTPNIDKLARDGMRFTSYYAPHPVCTPSRAALMTGCYAQRVGLPAVLYPQDNIGLNDGEITLAEMLKNRGYATACIGKWHLGHLSPFLPTRHGFDYYFGIPYPNDHGPERSKRNNPPIPLFQNEKIIEQPVNLHTLNDRLVDEAKKFIGENKSKPFFLYLPFIDAHTPWFVAKRFEGKSELGPYGDAVQEMDWSIGEVLKMLAKLNLEKNTLVVFASDNGPLYKPHAELEKIYGDAGRLLPQKHLLRGGKYSTWEGGVRVPMIVRWLGKTPANTTCNELAAGFDFYPTFAAITGAKLPSDRIIDGKNILPLLTGEKNATTPHETFFYFANYGLEAVRSGKWKLRVVAEGADGKVHPGIELFDLENDLSETTDVSKSNPQVVAKLRALAEQCRDDLGDSRQKRDGKNRRPVGKPSAWIPCSDSRFQMAGLPWFKENLPDLWRFPKSAREKIPQRVWVRAVAPDGGRIRFASDTGSLAVRVERKGRESKRCFLDLFLDGRFASSVPVRETNETELIFFANTNRALRDIAIYFPNNHEVRVTGISVDAEAKMEAARPFAKERPIVFYGSSVLQGTGAAHPSKTYPAILARQLDCDFVNLGFGGAGKAEPDVVNLVNSLDASCFVFDLGKSYGDQTVVPYRQMLAVIRKSHPTTPIVCVTPIYSMKEEAEPGYREKSEKLRTLMRLAANDQMNSGDKQIFVVEGLDLFGPADKDFFNDPLHPNDEGNERLAAKFFPRLKKIIF